MGPSDVSSALAGLLRCKTDLTNDCFPACPESTLPFAASAALGALGYAYSRSVGRMVRRSLHFIVYPARTESDGDRKYGHDWEVGRALPWNTGRAAAFVDWP